MNRVKAGMSFNCMEYVVQIRVLWPTAALSSGYYWLIRLNPSQLEMEVTNHDTIITCSTSMYYIVYNSWHCILYLVSSNYTNQV